MALEILDCAFVLFGGGATAERAQVAPLAGFGILLPRIEPVLPGRQLANHDPILKRGHASCKYSRKGIHQTTSFVTHSTIARGAQAPDRTSHIMPIGPSTFPVSPTATTSQPASGRRATSR